MDARTAARTVLDSIHIIAFKLGEEDFCVRTSAVREIRGWAKCMPLPNAPDYIRGVINLRGRVIPILDLGRRLGRDVIETTDRSAIIVTELGPSIIGLLVVEVTDMLNVPTDAMQPAPDLGNVEAPAFLEGIFALENGMTSILDPAAIHRAAAPAIQSADGDEPAVCPSVEMVNDTSERPAAFVS